MIRINGSYGELEREFDRLEKMPDFKTKAALDTVLRSGFAATQAAVHEETGSLKASGDSSTDTDRARARWEGNISYGGPSAGVNNPVDYAIYEQRRGVGGAGGISDVKGDHDFMRPLDALDAAYIEAIVKGLSG